MRLFSVLGVVGLLLATAAHAAPIIRNAASVGPGDLPRIQLLSSDDAGVSFLFELPTLSVEEISVGSQSFQVVAIPGGGLSGDVGAPGLPTFARLVSIPDDVGYSINAVPEDEVELTGYRLMPVQGEDRTGFSYDAASYGRAGFGSLTPAIAGRPAISRDLRVVPVTLQPVQYDPSRNVIKVAQRMRVDIRFNGHDPENARPARRGAIPPSFDRLYRELVVNYSGPPAGAQVEPGQYLVICQNDNNVITRLQPLLDWRKRMGYAVRLATTAETGSSNTSIKSFIQGVYNSGSVPLEYVCLVGDASGTYSIPTFHENLSNYHGEGDHEYTLLAGGDVLSDINIGRLSIGSTADLETEVAKIIGYETTPYTQDTSWFKRACLVGDPNSSGFSCVQVQQWIKEKLIDIGYTQIDTVFTNFVSGMTTALNRGDTIMSYRGYYQMSGWGNSNTNALTNGWKLPFCVAITCDTGSFESDGSCRTEGFLRAGNATTPKGGIGAIGTATTGTHTRFNNCIHVGIFYGLLYQGHTTMGSALTRGKYELYLNYQSVDPNRVVIWSTWNNLMGDPAVDIYLNTPVQAYADYPSGIPVGTNAVSLLVHDQGGSPIANALVCLYKGTETFVTGYSGSDGRVELPVNAATTGNMLVTVTKHDVIQHSGSITVSNAQQFVAYQSSSVVDNGSGSSSGNGDGVINPGETIELPVQVKNYGSQNAPGVTGTISSSDPYVTIVGASQSFGDVGAGASAWSSGNFAFSVAPACPHDHMIRLSLDLQSGTGQWHSIIDGVGVVSADLQSTGFAINGDGRIDPGETVQISVRLRNAGGSSAVNPTATLMTMSEFIDTPDQTGSYSTIDPNGSGENTVDTFTIHAAPETYQGYVANLQVLLDFSNGVKDTTYVQVPVGQRTSDDPTGPDAYGYYAFDDTDVSYPEHPTYTWVELDPSQGGSGGTEITLGDFGDEQDKSRTIDAPFPVVYYGRSYQKATVCSNGWITMGSTYLTDYRNWSLPSGAAIDNMIAVFWDELYQVNGTSKAFQRYDAADHRWIVEWSRFKDQAGGGNETFEVIFYDPAYVTTETGDAKFLMQYKEVSNPDQTDGYFTAGFQNADHTSGLTYSYFNQYPPGAATIAANRAIMIVPTREVIAGTIRGTVTNVTNGGTPIPGVTIRVVESGHDYTTGSDGTYAASERQGTYTVAAIHPSFAPDTVSNVVVTIGNSTDLNFALRDILAPAIDVTRIVTTSDTIGPYVARATINDFSTISETTLYYRVNGGEFTAVPMSSQGSGLYTAQIPGQRWTSTVEYYVYARDIGDNADTSPADAPTTSYVFYVAPQIPLYTDSMEFDADWTVGAPDDNATGGLWVNCDPNGTLWNGQLVQPEDDHTVDGSRCWVTGNAAPGGGQDLADVDGGKTTITSPRYNLSVVDGIIVLHYYRWFSNNTSGPHEDPWVVQISDDDGATWHELENTIESDRSWRLMEFDLSQYINFTDRVRVRFIAADYNFPSTVEAAIDDFAILLTGLAGAGVDDGPNARRFELAQNRPNPFNPKTVIRYSLEESGPANITIFDVSGRAVRRLVHETVAAGSHTIAWDGRDDGNHPLPSGIYLYRLDAGRRSDTKKMILLQ